MTTGRERSGVEEESEVETERREDGGLSGVVCEDRGFSP